MTTNGEKEPTTTTTTPTKEGDPKAEASADAEFVTVPSDSEDMEGGEFVEKVEDEDEADEEMAPVVEAPGGEKEQNGPPTLDGETGSTTTSQTTAGEANGDPDVTGGSLDDVMVAGGGEADEEDFGNIKDAISNLLKAQRAAAGAGEKDTSAAVSVAAAMDGLGGSTAMTEAVGNLVVELSDFVRGFSRKLGSMRSAFDMLSAQVTCLNDNIADRFTVQDAKINCILKKMNISDVVVQNAILSQSQSDISVIGSVTSPAIIAGSSSSSRKRTHAGGASSDVESSKSTPRGRSSGTSAIASTEKSSSAKAPAAKSARRKSPSPPKQKVITIGGTDVLGFTFAFQLRIGAMHFNSLEQAYQYIKFILLKKPNLAAQIKASWDPEDVKNLANEFNKKVPNKGFENQEEIMMALLVLKQEQCKEFEEKLKENGKDVVYAFCSGDLYWGCGFFMTDSRAKQPNAWKGRNIFGKVLNELASKLIDGALPKDPYDVTTFCHPELKIDPTKSIAVLSDLQLTNVSGLFSTQMKVVSNLTAASNPNDLEHTALYAFKKQEEKLMSGAVGGIMLLLGTYEVGKTPEKIETDYGRLLEYLTEKTSCPIYITNALPRTDKFADQVSLSNYAIRIATRKYEDKGVVLIDFHEAIHKLPRWKDMLSFNGYAMNREGKEILLELLAIEAPFANFKIQGSTGLSKPQQSSSSRSSPASSSDRGSYRGSSRGSGYRGNRGRLPAVGRGGSGPNSGNFAPPFLDGGSRRSGGSFGGNAIFYDESNSMGGGAPGFGQFTGGGGGRY